MAEKIFGSSTSAPAAGEDHFRAAVILPDGTRAISLGSGVITAMIGAGGMANIYKIWNADLEVHRAVKLMHPNLSEDSKRHFQTEMKIMAGLSHSNIVEIHSVGLWNGLPYIEMEYIDGLPLDAIIKERGALPVPVCCAIGIFIARALAYAHEKDYSIYGQTYHGIIHRDLKPSNIMISKDGAVKLMDFGIARPVEASLLTTDGALMGTMQYMAPEQLDGKSADITTDLYSLGAVMYEMITGVKAFPQVNITKLMACKVRNEYRPLNTYDLKIPQQLRSVIHRCLMEERRRRYQSARLLLGQLERIHRSLTSDTPEEVVRKFTAAAGGEKTILRLRHRIGILPVAAALAAALGIALLVGFAYQRRRLPAESSNVAQQTAPVLAPAAHPPSPSEHQTVSSHKSETKLSERATARVPLSTAPQVSEKTDPHRSLLELMKQRHGTADLAEMFVREVESRSYETARRLYEQLSPQQVANERVRIFYIRMLMAQGAIDKARQCMSGASLHDGEAYLYKAILAYGEGRLSSALDLLESCASTPARYMKAGDLRREYLYLRAKCLSKRAAITLTAQDAHEAMDAWYEVKAHLQHQPEHAYFREASEEMQRLRRLALGVP